MQWIMACSCIVLWQYLPQLSKSFSSLTVQTILVLWCTKGHLKCDLSWKASLRLLGLSISFQVVSPETLSWTANISWGSMSETSSVSLQKLCGPDRNASFCFLECLLCHITSRDSEQNRITELLRLVMLWTALQPYHRITEQLRLAGTSGGLLR